MGVHQHRLPVGEQEQLDGQVQHGREGLPDVVVVRLPPSQLRGQRRAPSTLQKDVPGD